MNAAVTLTDLLSGVFLEPAGCWGKRWTGASEDRDAGAGTLSEGGSSGGKKAGDGIKSVYQEFPKQVPSLTESTAPLLFQYLNSTV